MQSRLRKLYKKIFTRIMCAVVILAGGIAACSFSSKAADEPTYTLTYGIIGSDETEETAKVIGCEGIVSGDLIIPDTVEIEGQNYKVTEIDRSAFYYCEIKGGNLVLPNSVTKIGDFAFADCANLSGELVIPDSVTSISPAAFVGCSGFTKLILGKNVNSIGDNAFFGCEKLSGELVIPDSVKSIGKYVFYGCSNLSGELIIPDSVTTIGENTFNGCDNITSIYLPCKFKTSSLNIGHDYVIRHDFEKDGVIDEDKQTCEACGAKNICYKGIDICITNPTYDGSELAPTVLIEDGDKTLAGGTDYELVYETKTDVGKYEITINGINDYAGTINTSWYITSYKLNAALNPETKSAQITGVAGGEPSGELVISDTVEIDGQIYKVISIGNGAFQGCSNLSGELVIPDSIKSIGDNAFYGCDKLSGELVIPDSVESIGNYAFYGCSRFEKLTLGKNVNSIGNCAFEICSNLSGELVIPDSVKSIGDNAFFGCEKLSGELVIPDSVKSIGDNAFFGCEKLSGELVIPDSVESIGNSAFRGCSGFTKLTLGKKVNSIGNNAFDRCGKLSGELVIPDTVTSIGEFAFTNCTGFEKLTLGKKVNSIGNNAFDRCDKLSGELVIPDSVESIGNNAFQKCSGFTKLTLGKKVNVIGNEAFGYCDNLEGDVIIPDSVTSIGENAFSECEKITSISLPCKIDTLSLNIGHDYVIRHDFEKDGVYDTDKQTCEACAKNNICYKDIKVNITNPTYDGSELSPTVLIKNGEKTLEAGNDYELAYDKQTNAGEYEIAIKGINAYAGTIKTTWKINKATLSDDMLAKIKNEVSTNLKGKCGYALSTITFEDSHMAWEDSNCVMIGDEESSEPITRTFKVIYTPDDTDNYETATFDVNVEISHVKASPLKENNVEPTYEKDGSYDEVVYCEKCKTELSRDKKTVDKLVKPAPDDPDDPDSPDVPVGLENGDVINLAKQKCMIMVSDVKKHEASYFKSTNKKAKTVSVPATVKIDGITFKVTAISDSAFKNNTKATKIVISSNVKKLGKNLFKNLKKLKTIEIKSTKLTKKTIDKKTFAGLNKKATIKVPKKKLKAYKKLFKTKGLNKKIKVK